MKAIAKYSLVFGLAFLIGSCGVSTEPKVEDKVNSEMKKVVKEEVLKVSLDTNESSVDWKGELLGIYSHEGKLDFNKGVITIENGQLTAGSFSVDMKSMRATDENYKPDEGKTPEKLIGHLSSPDFFDVAGHPTASFEIVTVKGNEASGKLTVRGVTSEETVKNINIKTSDKYVKMSGDLTFDRQKYGVAYSAGKDAVLSDNIDLKITLVSKI